MIGLRTTGLRSAAVTEFTCPPPRPPVYEVVDVLMCPMRPAGDASCVKYY